MSNPYIADALSRLTSEFDKSPLLRGFIEAMVTPLESFESEADQLKTQRWIDTAIGEQLDGCGSIVNVLRQGRSDDEYRNAIKFQIFVNTSTATPNDLMKGLRLLTNPDDIQYIEQYPATAILFTDGPDIPAGLQSIVQSISPAGISNVPILVSYAHTPFRFSRLPTPAELFINSDADYLTIDGSDWQLSESGNITGPRLGGLAATDFSVEDTFFMGIDDGSELVFNDPNGSTVIESGYHLTGVF